MTEFFVRDVKNSKTLLKTGFERLRSEENEEGKYWEIWYLPDEKLAKNEIRNKNVFSIISWLVDIGIEGVSISDKTWGKSPYKLINENGVETLKNESEKLKIKIKNLEKTSEGWQRSSEIWKNTSIIRKEKLVEKEEIIEELMKNERNRKNKLKRNRRKVKR